MNSAEPMPSKSTLNVQGYMSLSEPDHPVFHRFSVFSSVTYSKEASSAVAIVDVAGLPFAIL